MQKFIFVTDLHPDCEMIIKGLLIAKTDINFP